MSAAALLQQHFSRSSSLLRQQQQQQLQQQQQQQQMAEISQFSLLWRRESASLQDLLACDIGDDTRSFLVSIRCHRENCPCALNNQEVLMMKPVRDIKLVSGNWMKTAKSQQQQQQLQQQQQQQQAAGTAASPVAGEKAIRVVLTDLTASWFEVLNENGGSIPHWGCVREVARHKPQAIFLRKDQKCLFARGRSAGIDLSADSSGIIKAGAVLNFIDCAKYRVVKHRKVKEQQLVKCSDLNGHLVFLGVDDKCAVSPVAGTENISGVHTLQSLLSKFQFPLSVRPVFGPPLPWLSFSDRYSLRLAACHRGDLLFLASLSSPERFFVVTPDMLEHHSFRVGESELQQHVQLLEKHSTRVTQFLQSYHPYEALRYLTKHLAEATNRLAPQERYCASADQQQRRHLGDMDQLLDEVEDIYFYVRTGRMPAPKCQSNSSNDSGLVLAAPAQRTAESLGVPADRPFRTASCEDLLLERREKRPPPPLPPRRYNSPVVRHQPHHRVAGLSAESLRPQSTDSSNAYQASSQQPQQSQLMHQQLQQQQQQQQQQPQPQLVMRNSMHAHVFSTGGRHCFL